MATRLRDSPTLSLHPSANPIARRAAGLPGRRTERAIDSYSSAPVTSSLCSAESATTTACSNGTDRARSTIVRAGVVTATPPTDVISSGSSGAARRWTHGPRRAPDRRARVAPTRSSRTPHTSMPCSSAADTWLITASAASSGTAARTSTRCRASGSAGGAPMV